jgi:endonuclease-3
VRAARRPRAEEKVRALAIIDTLAAAMPNARIELDYVTDLELLVAVILSAQCTDKRVNLVTPALFARCRTAADYAAMTPTQLEGYIKTCGLFRSKARNLIALGTALAARGGTVPRTRAELAELPGVGPKTAGVVSVHLGTEPAFPVDTHVGRLARRMGLSRQSDPNRVEQDLQALLPKERWGSGHQLLVWHGRRVCFARSPNCAGCPVATLCPRRGVTRAKREPASF